MLIKIIRSFLLLVVCLAHSIFAVAQPAASTLPPNKLQEMLKNSIARGFAASVLIDEYDTVTKVRKNAAFSGVVVSKDGLILTAAHVGLPGHSYIVIFPDGKEYKAQGLGRIQRFDAAILKITQAGNWPFAEMGWSSSLKTNEPCVSIAYPASFRPRLCVIRFGYVADVRDSRRGMIRSTCLMEPGDSGGPVFDLYGRVIGLHSNISLELENNFEIPIDIYRKYWTAMLKPEDYSTPPAEDQIPVDPLQGKSISYATIKGIEPQLAIAESKLNNFCIKLNNVGDSTNLVGTLVKLNAQLDRKMQQRVFIISKNSLITNEVIASLPGGKSERPKVLYRDDKRDLVLMELDKKSKLVGIDINVVDKTPFTFAELGKLLISPVPGNEGEISVLGTLQIKVPGMYSAGFLGSNVVMKEGRAVIQMVQENSPAASAGILVGDELITMDGVHIQTPETFASQIQKNKPGEIIKLIYNRSGSTDSVEVELGKRPIRTSTHVAEQFLDGKSIRRDGFENAFVHDSKLKPAECGGPVFDIDGNFVGINVARYSRTSAIALTAVELTNFLGEAFAEVITKKAL